MGKDKEVVVPGEKLAVIEEYLPRENVYVNVDFILSKIIGTIFRDNEKKEISVRRIKELSLPKVRDVIYGIVTSIRDPIAYVDIIYIENRNKIFLNPFDSFLHANNVSSMYVRSLYDAIGYGDIIRAYIVDGYNPPYELSIKGREFGVVYARCPLCMRPLRRKGYELFCSKCRKKFKRKISTYYFLK